MSKIKQTITALTSGDNPGGVRVSKEEKEPMSDERFRLVIQCVTRAAMAFCGVVLVINIDIWKLLALGGFGLFFALILGID